MEKQPETVLVVQYRGLKTVTGWPLVPPGMMTMGANQATYVYTNGQGFFITVFPDIGYVSLAWFTYDTELPPIDATCWRY